MSRPWCSLLILAVCALPASALAAADGRSAVRGSVVDPAGHNVPGVLVVVRSAAGSIRETRTDVQGAFELTGLADGRYDVLVTADGFRADSTPVRIAGTDVTGIDITLRLSGVTDTVVVSAGYVETPLSQAPGSVTTLTGTDLSERQITTVARALELVPGMTVAPTGGAGAITSLFPRGGDSNYTLVLVDGIRLNSFGGGFDFGHLSTNGLDQVEIVRGPQSAVFGADAIGGVIQLRTKIGGTPAMSGALETGGYGTTRLAAGTTGEHGAVRWGINVERFSSNGWTGLTPDGTAYVTNDDDRSTAVNVATGWTLSERSELRVDGRFNSDDRGNPGPFGSNPIGAFAGIDRVSRGANTDASGSVAFTHAWDAQSALRVQTTWADLRSTFVSPYGDSTARTRRFTTHAQVDHALSGAVATSFGADLNIERGESSYIQGTAGETVPIDRVVAGYFAEARFTSAARLFVTTGVRVEQIDRRPLEADPLAYDPRPAFPADRLLSVNPRLAASYYLRTSNETGGNWSRAHATAGTGIRPPDALEIAFTDNPGLKPERSRSADAGLEQALWGGRVVVDATAFVNRYTDLIVAVGRSLRDYSQFRTDNISNARARGLETSAAIRTKGGLEIRATYTWLDTAILAVNRSTEVAPPPFAVGDPLVRRPRHQASVDVVWTRGAVTAYGRIGGRSHTLDVEPSWGATGGLFNAPGFAVADAGMSVRLARGVDLLARVDNMLDTQYEAVFGYPAPRRSFTVGVRLAASR